MTSMQGYLLVECLCHIAFSCNDKLAFGALGQKRTDHCVKQAEIPRHIHKYLKVNTC